MSEVTSNKQFFVNLKVLLLQEGNVWVAQCLEKDIVAQGDTISDVIKAFKYTLVGQFILDTQDNKIPLEDIAPAPAMYWEMYNKAKMYEAAKPLELPKDILPAWVIGATSELRLSMDAG